MAEPRVIFRGVGDALVLGAVGVFLAVAGCTDGTAPAPSPRIAPEATEAHAPAAPADSDESWHGDPDETEDDELQRLVTTQAEAFSPLRRGNVAPEVEQAHRREVVVAARARAESDIANGTPQIVLMGLTMGDCPDVDPTTGFPYNYLGCVVGRDDRLDCEAYNLAIKRAHRAGRIVAGSLLDRFVTLPAASEWLLSRGVRLDRGGAGVQIPGSEGFVRIPQAPCGSWQSASDGASQDLFDIDRPSVKANRAGGWPALLGPSALVAFREDGKVFLVAEPPDPDRWSTCFVFDAATGYHLHTIRRPAGR